MKFDPYGTSMINRGNRILNVFLFILCMTFIANVVNLACLVTLTFWLKTLFKFFVYVTGQIFIQVIFFNLGQLLST